MSASPTAADQALASLEALERALARLLPSADSFQASGAPGASRQADNEDHERAARAFADAATHLDALLASASASHAPDHLSSLRSEERRLREELEKKRELVQSIASKIDGWRARAKEALIGADAADGGVGGVQPPPTTSN